MNPADSCIEINEEVPTRSPKHFEPLFSTANVSGYDADCSALFDSSADEPGRLELDPFPSINAAEQAAVISDTHQHNNLEVTGR